MMNSFFELKTVHEVVARIDELGKDGHGTFNSNFLFADSSGNIGYMFAVAQPRRKDETPYLGCRVLDGTKSDFDWLEGNVPVSELPRSINPKKGYIVTANNRQVSDNAVNDFGATSTSTGRAQRIDEMIQEHIDAGKKFTTEDMSRIQ